MEILPQIIIPNIINLADCVSRYNLACAKLGLTCQSAQSEYQKVIHRFNPVTECNLPKFKHNFQDSCTLLIHNELIKIYPNAGDATRHNVISAFGEMNLDEKNLSFFIKSFPYLYHCCNVLYQSHYSTFIHLFIQSKKNPIFGETMRNFFIKKGICLSDALPGLVASSTLADVNCLITCFCTNTQILPLIEKFLDYPHVLDHLFRMVWHYPSREQSLSLLMKYFKSNPQLISKIIQFYRDTPKAYTFDEIRKVILHTIYEVGYNKYDTTNQKLIDKLACK